MNSVPLPETPPAVRPAGPGEAPESEELARRQRRHPELSQGEAVASVIIYRTLAGLLPHNYDPDKRSLRRAAGEAGIGRAGVGAWMGG